MRQRLFSAACRIAARPDRWRTPLSPILIVVVSCEGNEGGRLVRKGLLVNRTIIRLLGLVTAMFCSSVRAAPANGASDGPRRVKVLFLGDRGHHEPIERCRDACTPLAVRGIDLTYTEDLDDLNPTALAHYDALLLYANWTSIAPAQEKALIDYVEE